MTSEDLRWTAFTEAVLDHDYETAWEIADRGTDSLTVMERTLLLSSIRTNTLPQAIAAWMRVFPEESFEPVDRFLRARFPAFPPLSDLEIRVNRSLDEAYAACKDVEYF